MPYKTRMKMARPLLGAALVFAIITAIRPMLMGLPSFAVFTQFFIQDLAFFILAAILASSVGLKDV